MSDTPPPRSRSGPLAAIAAIVLCGAGGFFAYRLANPPSTLHPVPAATRPRADSSPPPPASGAPEPVASHPIPEWLPDFALPDLAGSPRRLADWKGHPLVVNFWATWCEPCRREIPLFKALRRERKPDSLEIVGIAVDFRDSVREYAEQSHIDYPVLNGEQGGYAAVASFGMEPVLPFSVFADAAGRIITVKVGELHRDEAELILDRIRDLGRGRMDLVTARGQIAAGLRQLAAHRAGAAAQ